MGKNIHITYIHLHTHTQNKYHTTEDMNEIGDREKKSARNHFNKCLVTNMVCVAHHAPRG